MKPLIFLLAIFIGAIGLSQFSYADDGEIYVVTAYCSCKKCCGPNAQGIFANGERVSWGGVAADRSVPFGTKIRFAAPINGRVIFTVKDRGGAIVGNRLDVWFPLHEQALQFGVQRLRVTLYR